MTDDRPLNFWSAHPVSSTDAMTALVVENDRLRAVIGAIAHAMQTILTHFSDGLNTETRHLITDVLAMTEGEGP